MNYAYTQPVYGSSYPPRNGFISPQHGQIRPRVVFDGGNRFVKWIDPNNVVQCLLSVVKEVSEYQWKRLKPDDQSVLIEIDGKRFVIGRLAQELGGEPTFQTDKCQLASILALAAIQPNPGQTAVHIQQMIVALPNTLNDDDVAAVKRIANHPLTKEFKRNGEYITYTVGEVVPVDETEPAFHYALNQGFFSFPEAKNAIWDLGGGTAIARIYTPNGTMIHDAEVILPGTKALAQQVAVEMKEVYSLDYSPSLQGIMDAISRAGDYDSRSNYQADHLANTVKFLERHEAEEYAFLLAEFENIGQYLTQVEPGKRFYAYRFLFGWFGKLKGRQLPTYQSMALHLQDVTIDSRVNRSEISAIAQAQTQLPPTVDIKQLTSPQIDIRDTHQAASLSKPEELQPSANGLSPETITNLTLAQRANALIAALTKSGFKVEDMMSSQVIAIAGTQRGGKGTLAAILATLSLALDSGLNTQYFTAGVDVYPFSCNLISALKYPEKDADGADKLVARDLLKFLKGLDGCEPYSHKNLLLVIDEAMRLLSLLDESDRTWAIQYLLSRFAKSGGTLIIVLHGSNLTSVVGKATAGLADTFKQSVNFIGCVAQSVSAGGLRKINVASGEYFKANPNNFAEPVNGGNLGMIPDWLKIELHPGNGQPDPARTLLKFFPELVQHHEPAVMPRGEKIAPDDAVNKLESIFSKPTQEVEIAEVEEASISEADFEQILNIVTSAVATPVSFAAIRNSRKWGEDKPSVRYLRSAIAQLIESKQLNGSEKLGFTAFSD